MPLPPCRVAPLLCALLAALLAAGAWRRAASRSAAEAAAAAALAAALPRPHVPHAAPPGAPLPLILFSDSYFRRDFVRRDYSFEDCPVECALTWDRSREAEVDAVWFFSPWTSRAGALPAVRARPQQLWVWAASESPGNWYRSASATSAGLRPPDPVLDRVFNWSMTYQRDSDVLFSYGAAVALPPVAHAGAARAAAAAHAARVAAWLAGGKPRHAAWTVSHCRTAARREEYVAALRAAGAAVDVYGKCADVAGKLAGVGHARHAALLRTYKFYLAFENRLCRDYITEKFWVDALLNGAIPVVRGGLSDADYAAVAPPGSYINADWFPDAAALAAHLDAVSRNATAFAGYHAWRAAWRLTADSALNWAHSRQAESAATCRLCEALHARAEAAARGQAQPPRTLNLTQFWSMARSCREPADVPQRELLFGRAPGQESPDRTPRRRT